ncbi:MAG: hypothetical protein AMXMBFR12_03470 [Candidatus Babeliales bacterium]
MLNAQQKVLENTSYYLENYLNSNGKWNKKIFPKERINKIRYADVDWQAISDHIKGMDYQDFLKTPYWKTITAHAKYKVGYRCQLCNSTHRLVTHHRNYDIHGREHAHMHELIVICDECHTIFHDRISKMESKDEGGGAAFTGILILVLIAFSIYCFFAS